MEKGTARFARSLLCRPENTPLRRDFQRDYGRGTLGIGASACELLAAAEGDTLLVFFHGGGYLGGITGLHWNYVRKILQDFSGLLAVPLYPAHSAKEAFSWLEACMQQLQRQGTFRRIFFMGDSSGGGMALSLAQLLARKGKRTPEALLLLSPCLCLDGRLPGAAQLLPMERIRGEWARELPLDDGRLSPVYETLAGLGRITLYTGTADPLYPQAVYLRERGVREGVPITWAAFPGEGHDFLLLPKTRTRVEFPWK